MSTFNCLGNSLMSSQPLPIEQRYYSFAYVPVTPDGRTEIGPPTTVIARNLHQAARMALHTFKAIYDGDALPKLLMIDVQYLRDLEIINLA